MVEQMGLVRTAGKTAVGSARDEGHVMRIIEVIVTKARRSRDWGRVEAQVALTYQAVPGGSVQRRVLFTSAPERDPKGRDLRTCLVADAVRLAAMTEGREAEIAVAA